MYLVCAYCVSCVCIGVCKVQIPCADTMCMYWAANSLINQTVLFLMQVGNLRCICDSLLYYDVLQKRKAFLDAFAEGLEVFHLKTAVNLFPALFEPLFVSSGKCSPDDVLGILDFSDTLVGHRERVANYLKAFISELG